MYELQKILLEESSLVKRIMPLNLEQQDSHYFFHEAQIMLPACYALKYENVFFSEDGVLYTKNLNFIRESVVEEDPLDSHQWRYVLANVIKKKIVRYNNNLTYVNIINLWSFGFAHWILDSLPRLYASKDLLKDVVVLLPQSHNRQYVIESLKMFDIKGVEFMPANSYAYVKNMWLITEAAPQGQFNENIVSGLRTHACNYLKIIGLSNFGIGEKVYISRKKAPKRHIINEEDIQKIVKDLGFSVVCFEDMNIFQQMALMNNAKYVVSLHGAGLANMLFMPSNTHLLEIRRRDDTQNNLFFSLASAIQVHYWYQLADYQASPKADGKNFDTFVGNYYDVIVDVDLLRANVEKMLAYD